MKFSSANLNSEQLRSLSDFFVNVATVWLVAGTITPVFTKPPLTVVVIFDTLIGVAGAAGFLYVSLFVYKETSK